MKYSSAIVELYLVDAFNRAPEESNFHVRLNLQKMFRWSKKP